MYVFEFLKTIYCIDRYVPQSSQWKTHTPRYPVKTERDIDRRLDVPTIDDGSPPNWDDLDNYHHKIAQIIQYETSAEVHFPGSSEYKRRRVRNGTCRIRKVGIES